MLRIRVVCSLLFVALSVLSVHGQSAVKANGIAYKRVGDRELLLDIARPLPRGVARPAIVFLCGNGWGYLKSTDRRAFSYGLDMAVARGYVGITVDSSSFQESSNRRPIGTFPAPVHDVKSAIRFIRAHAKEYDIDARRIGAVGFSSGGTLSLLIGFSRPSDGLEGKDEYSRYSSAVQAVVSIGAPTDMVDLDKAHRGGYDSYIGGPITMRLEQYERASPINYVRPDCPPTLIIQGADDDRVLVKQAMHLDVRMREVGAPHALLIKKGKGHFDFELEDPAVWSFLDKELKH